ncbi:MAG: hypothetical protein MOP51_510 [Citricoccus sp.]|jgi:hypothetical protein|nr:hypothetical protein [Citricoccus sp. WCRC_4]
MTSTAAAPLPVLYLPPPDPGTLANLLLHQVAACVAAVGHRLHVQPRPPGTVPDAVAEFSADHGREPAMVIIGRLETGPATEPRAGAVSVATVTLDGAASTDPDPSTLSLPTRSRPLCRLLARSADPGLPGRAVVLAHHGDGAGGDDGWPGLPWGLTLLLGGPGRGVLVDLRGTEGGLDARLRADSETSARPAVPGPTPGPALATRLPAAGGVRWGSMTGSPAEVLPVIGAAVDTFRWTVLDVGRNAQLASALAAEGLPVLTVTGEDGTCCLEVPGRPPDRLALDPSPWGGPTPASWARSARRRVAIDLAARLTAVLSRDPAEVRR